MATTINKQRLLNLLFNTGKKSSDTGGLAPASRTATPYAKVTSDPSESARPGTSTSSLDGARNERSRRAQGTSGPANGDSPGRSVPSGSGKERSGGASSPMAIRPILEEFLYSILREDMTAEDAERAFQGLCTGFFDWNEIRVSSPREVEEAMGRLPRGDERAQRILKFLQEVFETTFSFDLEALHKKEKGLKQAAKQLSRFEASNDYSVSWVVQRCLGGHAVPVDAPTLRCTRRLGLVDSAMDDPEAVRSSLEHLVPKAKGVTFTDRLSEIARDYCTPEPMCSRCPLAPECPTGQGDKMTR